MTSSTKRSSIILIQAIKIYWKSFWFKYQSFIIKSVRNALTAKFSYGSLSSKVGWAWYASAMQRFQSFGISSLPSPPTLFPPFFKGSLTWRLKTDLTIYIRGAPKVRPKLQFAKSLVRQVNTSAICFGNFIEWKKLVGKHWQLNLHILIGQNNTQDVKLIKFINILI